MADYDWGPACGCGFMQEHRPLCKDNPQYEVNKARHDYREQVRPLGFVPVEAKGWQCRRGCGTIVWDIETHIKNVCPTFEPVVGS